jgi:hypothetical protein
MPGAVAAQHPGDVGHVATQHHAVWDYFPQSRYDERVSSLEGELAAAA